MPKYVSILLVVVGLVLATAGGAVLWSVYHCETTESITVQQVEDDAADPVRFDALSERQRDAFRRALDGGHATVDDDLDLPYKIIYENEMYAVYTAHGDACWITAIPAVPVVLVGLALLAYGGRRYRQG